MFQITIWERQRIEVDKLDVDKELSKYRIASQSLDTDTFDILKESLIKVKEAVSQLEQALYYKPIQELVKLYQGERWFEGLILSCVYFHRIGIKKLREYAKSNTDLAISSNKIKNMRLVLDEALVLLHITKIINRKTYTDMGEIRDIRNDLVHEPDTIKDFDSNPDEAKRLLQNGIRCVDKLRKAKINPS